MYKLNLICFPKLADFKFQIINLILNWCVFVKIIIPIKKQKGMLSVLKKN